MTATGTARLETPRDDAADRRLVRAWLWLIVAMVVAMVVVGGATRLTGSGLSITEWKPIHGVIPPLNEAAWQEEFAKYRQIPEYRVKNFDMDLTGFKAIFWWEWGHRLLGRAIGFVVLVPLVFFWATGRLGPGLAPRLLALLTLGGLQGAIGWWMVVSGLSVRTDVSQYRLAIHLTLAFVILAYAVWLAIGLRERAADEVGSGVRAGAVWVLAVTIVQVFLGGLVAGLDAGLTFNTWPLMDGGLVPPGVLALSPWWINLFENVATVQFQHRMVAYVLVVVALVHAFRAAGTPVAGGATAVAGAVLAQSALGVVTLLWAVPISLGLLHQFGATLVLIAATMHLRAMYPAFPVPRTVTP